MITSNFLWIGREYNGNLCLFEKKPRFLRTSLSFKSNSYLGLFSKNSRLGKGLQRGESKRVRLEV